MEIVVLGTGCPNCKKVEQVAKDAVAEMALEEAAFRKVTDWDEIMQYNILRTPGLAINGKVVCSGRIPTKAEVISWITTALEQDKA